VRPKVTPCLSLFLALLGGGVVLLLSEPAAFLSQQVDDAVLRCMPAARRGRVCKVVLPAQSSSDDIADQVLWLKSNGVPSVLVMASAADLVQGVRLHEALRQEGVVWVGDPAGVDPRISTGVTCRPILVCQRSGAAVVAETGGPAAYSATASSLLCSDGADVLARIGARPFRIPFRSGTHPEFTQGGHFVLACVIRADSEDQPRHGTPVGTRTPSDYALDVCQALLDRRYLIDGPAWFSYGTVAGVAVVVSVSRRRATMRAAMVGIPAAMAAASMAARVALPTGAVVLMLALGFAAKTALAPPEGPHAQG
jgi:hypothetical protein